jgi:hypothetical protein
MLIEKRRYVIYLLMFIGSKVYILCKPISGQDTPLNPLSRGDFGSRLQMIYNYE